MKRSLVSCLLLLCCSALSAQDNYKQAWAALNRHDHTAAANLLGTAVKSGNFSPDLFITKIYLDEYTGRERFNTTFAADFYDKTENPYPYIYALWFSDALVGSYGKKTNPHQLLMIEKLINDQKAPGTLVASAHYQKGAHLLFSGRPDSAAIAYSKVGNLRNWQYAGPFENLSESGFYKNYGPLENPDSSAVFLSSTNAPVKWFTPAAEIKDGWTPVSFQFNKRTAVAYAQTFVTAGEDMDILLNAGVTGAIKVWLNDELLISEYKERITEMDAYTVAAHLKKGVNRVLVQLSYSNSQYPNFNIRLTDKQFRAIPGLNGSSQYKPYNKVTSPTAHQLLPQFAEAFFQQKIAADSANMVNYLLLASVYNRNKKTLEARHLTEKALERAPDNCLLRLKLIEILGKEDNRSQMLEEIEKIKKADPESLLAMELKIKDEIANEKLEDALVSIGKRAALYGEDQDVVSYRISILAKQNKYDELLKAAEEAYEKYPELPGLQFMMYTIKKEVYKDTKAAFGIYEKYFENNFNYEAVLKYAQLLEEQGQSEKNLAEKNKLIGMFPYDPSGYASVANYYHGIKDYEKAEPYIRKALALSPYNEYYWERLGDIKRDNKQPAEAIAAYNRSLQFSPNQYELINKVRLLQGKPETYKLFPQTDIDAVIRENGTEKPKSTDYGYYILRDEKNVIMHPGGATEVYALFMVKITSEKGIDRYKESSIGYGSSQELLIEKAELVKKSGTRIQGERNDNQVVFTNLEIGDVVVFKYRLQHYGSGRFARDYWDKFHFNGQVYTVVTSYNLLLPADQKVRYTFTNSNVQPVTKNVEDFKMYSWEVVKMEPLKEEPLMPVNVDVASVLHISTLASWQDIATWYADITSNRSEEEYEITALYRSLFPDTKNKQTQFKQAQTIYNYIEKNIRYSSVSFRQGAYVPQRASATLTTRLGDCKDLSNLFVTLCRMAGIECQLVLTDTRDNGATDMILPSLEFNHCIVKAKLDNKEYYIELTDNYLPFASVPNNLLHALILEIPPKKTDAAGSELKSLDAVHRTKDIVRKTIRIKPSENDLDISISALKYGALSANTRQDYVNLEEEKQLTEMERVIASSYKNNIKLLSLKFNDLGQLSDSVSYNYRYTVKNEIAEIGSMYTFRITYPDVVASLNNFTADTRTYRIEYLNYEDADEYQTIVHIDAPAGKKFVELPVNQELKYGKMSYSLTYKLQSPGKLTVTRNFRSDRNVIPASEYAAFKSFFEKIVKAEQKMIAYK
ncbi:transglutaminase domain-containing protein [Sediminibacterium ginsengisoli]|uniref:TPR repeat-containing protein n=1 Tax=Sediminibacterium ginsengisoli TaxID=413434 RepID=A0A1T4PHC5_9BACT|nr:transglutaminase domain-containing protein [Sediminibacterium ginsengisoli]SJZ90912.1 TPR repeat-containing protein [Sediminibacterium ginsengisoli]